MRCLQNFNYTGRPVSNDSSPFFISKCWVVGGIHSEGGIGAHGCVPSGRDSTL